MHMFFCISLSFNLCVVVRVGSIGSWLALISVMMGTSIYCVVVPTRGRSISLLVMVRFGGMHIDLIYWPLFGRVGQLNLTWKKCTYSHFRMEKIHIGIHGKISTFFSKNCKNRYYRTCKVLPFFVRNRTDQALPEILAEPNFWSITSSSFRTLGYRS